MRMFMGKDTTKPQSEWLELRSKKHKELIEANL